MTKKLGFNTRAVHGGAFKDQFGALQTPVYRTSTFVFDDAEQGGRRFAGEEDGMIYCRLGNPTTGVLEEKIASLENAEAGVAFSSGMGAITSAIYPFVKAGDHIIASKTLYGCTFAFLCEGLRKFDVEVSLVDTSNTEETLNAVKDNTKIIYLETPANPTLVVSDIEAISKGVEDKDIRVIVDNTFSTPYLQRPLDLGAHIVVHSATKYLNGHGDMVAGLAVGSAEDMAEVRLVGLKDFTGAVISPEDAFNLIRGMKTLGLRMDRHVENAKKVVEFLVDHKNIEKVYYPGLEDDPGYEVAKKQMVEPGAMISFEVKGGIEGGRTVLNNVKLVGLAVSLGNTETLIQHPASMTHSTHCAEELAEAGIPEGLIRFSVGLEDVEDIIADLDQALNMIE